jgi:putative endonuclease
VFKAFLRRLRARADERLPAHLRDARRGEDLAYEYLCRLGYRIVARNFRARAGKGEIDLVGWDGDRLAFVEVKTRASEEYGAPDRAVGSDKRRFLVRTANEYARRANADPACMRFDVVSVVLEAGQPRISLEKNAFSARAVRGRLR